MTEPRYILLTVKKITVPTRGGQSQSTFLQPVVRKLFPLPMPISMAQHGREAEVDAGAGMVLTMAEDFNDVLAALESAAASGKFIVRPIQRGAIDAAVLPMGRTLEQDIEDVTSVVDQICDGARDFQRRAEGAMHQDKPTPSMAEQIAADLRDGTFQGRSGPPTPRAISAGDLRIFHGEDSGGFWIEVANHSHDNVEGEKPVFEWSRFGVPPELLPIYDSAEAARQAVKVAGYIRRLIEA